MLPNRLLYNPRHLNWDSSQTRSGNPILFSRSTKHDGGFVLALPLAFDAAIEGLSSKHNPGILIRQLGDCCLVGIDWRCCGYPRLQWLRRRLLWCCSWSTSSPWLLECCCYYCAQGVGQIVLVGQESGHWTCSGNGLSIGRLHSGCGTLGCNHSPSKLTFTLAESQQEWTLTVTSHGVMQRWIAAYNSNFCILIWTRGPKIWRCISEESPLHSVADELEGSLCIWSVGTIWHLGCNRYGGAEAY